MIMLRQKIAKIVVAVACIVSIIVPCTAPVFAAIPDGATTAKLRILERHKGGYPAEGELTSEELEKYDTTPWKYKVNNIIVYKITEYEDNDFQDHIYCVDATVTFPGYNDPFQEYENKGSFFNTLGEYVRKLHMGTDRGPDSNEWNANYQAVCRLLKESYISGQGQPTQKDTYLKKAFANFEDERLTGKTDDEKLSIIRTYLTDDDIDVVQQEAIWRFTNGDTAEYTSINTITREFEMSGEVNQADMSFRDKLMKHLYSYLVESAQQPASSNSDVPTFGSTSPKASSDDDFYIAGPFKILPGSYNSSDITARVLDQEDGNFTNYRIRIDGETEFTDKKINEILNKDFYIYIPKTERNISKVQIQLEYSTFDTEATLWLNKKQTDDSPDYQPVVIVKKKPTTHKPTLEVELDRSVSDLAVRKYIVKVNDTEVNRKPTVDATNLKNGSETTAKYKHAKNPVQVKAGDTIVFEIRVYNEGDVPAKNIQIADTMPKGFEFDENDELNRTYGWEKAVNGEGENRTVYITGYLKDELRGFNKESDSVPPSEFVQIKYKVSEDVVSSKVLTTISEVAKVGDDDSNFKDRDSTPQNNDYVKKDQDAANYSGDINNKADLTDSNYFYKGYQDDDDFEKVEVLNPEKPAFDMSLKKFVSAKKGSGVLTSSREPKVNVAPLKSGKTDAEYTIPKTGVQVKVGDIITYTIRVYNEGQVDGYAEEVIDYIPEGLGYITEYKDNVDNYWELKEYNKEIKLGEIENAVNNVKKEDFTEEVKELKDAIVVSGKAKIVSKKLKSEATGTSNLIKAFDKENGTALDYKDIKVTCVVLSTDDSGNKLRNIGEIVKTTDKDRNVIEDVDSTPNSVNPDSYPDSEKRTDGTPQDDNDYENLSPEPEKKRNFDLSLKKFITKAGDTPVNDRIPIVTKGTNGKPVITTPNKNPIKIANGQLITYTIRVYNEGDTAGYAKEVMDNIPAGLVFVAEDETNKKYGWKMYDKNGNETTDLNQAIRVKTDYLSLAKSKARNENCLLQPYDAENGKISYQDLLLVFRVDETKIDASRGIVNIAEIYNDEDENGDPIDDVDSITNNNKDGEDDLDKESVIVKKFDLALQKYLSKIIITENGQMREINVKSTDGLQKVEIHKKRINTTEVKFVYTIVVTNQGEIEGFADEIIDYIPEGLEFVPGDNPGWTKVTDKAATTDQLIKKRIEPGQSEAVTITLRWKNGENNFGMKDNIAEISKASNPYGAKDIDSTPGNFVAGEDDQDNAQVMLSISTGNAPTYILLGIGVVTIISVGSIMIKKYVL